ncbi:uncharacterized protein LOC130965897 [Arachis stenosperma]|uniref:uncharacterized protein LOC130965897 n=1 Tax=Arachis stenosperma TaxID=217475 RepID=UPI0025AC75BA|nr:uncharacterized protein LOC130965897 [Arachis stenosperma]
MLSNMGGVGSKEVGRIAHRFLYALSNNEFTNRLFWIDGDQHVRVMFDLHARLMSQHVMELYATVRYVVVGGGPSPSAPKVVPLEATPIHYAQPHDSADDSDSEDDSTYVVGSGSSSDIVSEDEFVPETPNGSVGRFLLSPPLAIAQLSDPDDLLNTGDGKDYNTNGGGKFQIGHRFSNREAVLMAVKNYNIRRNVEYRVLVSDRLKYHCRCIHQWLSMEFSCSIMTELKLLGVLSIRVTILSPRIERCGWQSKKTIVKFYGDWEESYNRIPTLLQALQQCLPAFKHCKPFLLVDRTHLYGKYGGDWYFNALGTLSYEMVDWALRFWKNL